MNTLIKVNNAQCWKNAKLIHTSVAKFVDQDWRSDQRLPMNPNAEGPLTNLPDYTYMDGRPTPLGQRQKTRALFQRELAQKIVTGSWEIDFAIKRHQKIKDDEVKAKQNVLDSKLKPKGHLLLKKK